MKSILNIKTFLAVLAALVALSCVEKLTEQDGDLGRLASDEEVQKAIDEATMDISVLDTTPGNFVDYEYNVRLETGSVYRLGKVDRSLIDRKETSDVYTFVYFENYFEYELSGAIRDEWHKERVAQFLKNPAIMGSLKIFSLKEQQNNSVCDGKESKDNDGHTYDCIKYFNLKSERQLVPAPENIRSRPNCLGLPGCQLDTHLISYDEVKWSKGKAVYKEQFTVTIAPQIPHIFPESGLPPTFSLCSRRVQDLGEHKNILVTSCRVLRDMKY